MPTKEQRSDAIVEAHFDRSARIAIARRLAVDLADLLHKYDTPPSLFLGAPALVMIDGVEIGTIDLDADGDAGREFIFKPKIG